MFSLNLALVRVLTPADGVDIFFLKVAFRINCP